MTRSHHRLQVALPRGVEAPRHREQPGTKDESVRGATPDPLVRQYSSSALPSALDSAAVPNGRSGRPALNTSGRALLRISTQREPHPGMFHPEPPASSAVEVGTEAEKKTLTEPRGGNPGKRKNHCSVPGHSGDNNPFHEFRTRRLNTGGPKPSGSVRVFNSKLAGAALRDARAQSRLEDSARPQPSLAVGAGRRGSASGTRCLCPAYLLSVTHHMPSIPRTRECEANRAVAGRLGIRPSPSNE